MRLRILTQSLRPGPKGKEKGLRNMGLRLPPFKITNGSYQITHRKFSIQNRKKREREGLEDILYSPFPFVYISKCVFVWRSARGHNIFDTLSRRFLIALVALVTSRTTHINCNTQVVFLSSLFEESDHKNC